MMEASMTDQAAALVELQKALDTIESAPRLPSYARTAVARARESATALAGPGPIGNGVLTTESGVPSVRCPSCGNLHTNTDRHLVVVAIDGTTEPFDLALSGDDLAVTWDADLAAFRCDCGVEFYGIDRLEANA